jgi:hypothetical protein
MRNRLYSVFFLNQPADACAWAASIASTSIANIPSSGYLTLQQGMSTNEVDVRTYVSGGTFADQPFMLSIFCYSFVNPPGATGKE